MKIPKQNDKILLDDALAMLHDIPYIGDAYTWSNNELRVRIRVSGTWGSDFETTIKGTYSKSGSYVYFKDIIAVIREMSHDEGYTKAQTEIRKNYNKFIESLGKDDDDEYC